ncbi:MAG: hypothetical protein ABI598_00785 [Chloroflexota bacterium]
MPRSTVARPELARNAIAELSPSRRSRARLEAFGKCAVGRAAKRAAML